MFFNGKHVLYTMRKNDLLSESCMTADCVMPVTRSLDTCVAQFDQNPLESISKTSNKTKNNNFDISNWLSFL